MGKNTPIYFLFIFIFSLPLTEAIKNISWFLYIITWFYTRRKVFKNYEFLSGFLKPINIMLMLVIISPYIVATFSDVNLREWDGAWDVLRYGLVGITICNTKFSEKEISKIFQIMLLSTFLAILYGNYKFLSLQEQFIKLHSVGHVNHSSIYLAIILCLLLSIIITFNKISVLFITYSVAFFCLLFSILEMAARGAIIPLFISFLLIIFLRKEMKNRFIIFSVFILLILSISYFFEIEFINKFMNAGTSNRIKLLNSSYLLFIYSPIFGVGLENSIFYFEHERFLSVCNSLGVNFNKDEFQTDHVHAHNFYMQSLVERGLFGTIPQILLLIFWIKTLISYHKIIRNKIMFIAWNTSLSSFLIISIGGIFNTTFHHENATLSLIIFSVTYSLFNNYHPIIHNSVIKKNFSKP